MRTSLRPLYDKLVGTHSLERFPLFGSKKRDWFTNRPGTYFWSNGSAWGTCTVAFGEVALKVLKGYLKIDRIRTGDKILKSKKIVFEKGREEVIKL